jgi:CheY-like chemotaxis protein
LLLFDTIFSFPPRTIHFLIELLAVAFDVGHYKPRIGAFGKVLGFDNHPMFFFPGAGADLTMPPVIVYTGRELAREDELALRKHAETIIIKGVKSEERLLDEVSLFLHKTVSSMPPAKREMIITLHQREAMFSDKTILLVDDDMRNLFALSKILDERGLQVLKAEDGQKALTLLDSHPEIALVLLDIMMPVMDGYQTAREIRKQARFRDLPIIALTAKALKEDRNRCIAAGANDYLAKPVDIERLFSMLRVWLYRRECIL